MIFLSYHFFVAIALLSMLVLYGMYRYFNETIQQHCNETMKMFNECQIAHDRRDELKQIHNQINTIELKFKDSIQNSALCCKTASEKIWNEINNIKSRIVNREQKKPMRRVTKEQENEQ